MKRDNHDNVRFFIGGEVEHTPAYGKKTLFVVGKQDVVEIEKLAREHKTTHIFMGANHSFTVDPTDATFYWRDTITELLDKGFTVTLDYEAHLHQNVLPMFTDGVWQSRLFIPLLSVRVPKVQTSNPNLTIKIDDIDFKATNPGVWCMHFNEVTDSNRFTDWQDYETDIVIEQFMDQTEQPVATPIAPAKVLPVVENKEPVVPEVINKDKIGLDEVPTTALRSEDTTVQEVKVTSSASDMDAANAYADGATADPIAAEGKKIKATKK